MATFAILGLGRLGRALAGALTEQGASVACWNRSPADHPLAEQDPFAAVARADTVVLAVSDDALAPLAASLAVADWSSRAVIHCSGRSGVEPLAPLAARGAVPVAAHPVMAFAGNAAADMGRMAGIGWGVTADDAEGLRRGFAFARLLGGQPFAVAAGNRDLYHAGLAHAINHLATLAVQGTELLTLAGAPEPAAVLRPALEAALANALSRGAAAATGPVVRGDVGTVAAHLRALGDAAPAVQSAYAAMTRAGIGLALTAGRITDVQAARLGEALGDVPGGG